MKTKKTIKMLTLLVLSSMSYVANATVVNTLGAVSSFTNLSQITGSIIGTADFQGGIDGQIVASDTYSAQGMNFIDGIFSAGTAGLPRYSVGFATNNFDGVVTDGMVNYFGGVAVFDNSLNVTQFGLDASSNGTQFLTAFDTAGVIIGQTSWNGHGAGFIGIDTLGITIGMIAFGNDDLFNGTKYSLSGSTNISDNWVWAGDALAPSAVPVPAAAWLFGSALLGFFGFSRRKANA